MAHIHRLHALSIKCKEIMVAHYDKGHPFTMKVLKTDLAGGIIQWIPCFIAAMALGKHYFMAIHFSICKNKSQQKIMNEGHMSVHIQCYPNVVLSDEYHKWFMEGMCAVWLMFFRNRVANLCLYPHRHGDIIIKHWILLLIGVPN